MRPGSTSRLRRILALILVAVLLHQVDFWGFGLLFFERTPTIPMAVLVWFIQNAIRTGFALYTLTEIGYLRREALSRTTLLLGYFIIGVTGITTDSVVHLILGVSYYPEILNWILPYRLIAGFTQEAARIVFGIAGIPYHIYLIPYGFLIEPLFTELPRLLSFIIVVRALGFTYVAKTDSGLLPSPSTPQNRPHHRSRGPSQGLSNQIMHIAHSL